MYEAVVNRDYPVLQGAFLLLAISVIAANLLADLLYSVLDPRVKAE
jgi:peptide/nickel transport system permease protein